MTAQHRFVAIPLVLTLGACSGVARPQPKAIVAYDPRALPSGPPGQSIAYGHAIIVNTQTLMRKWVRADLSCADCHIAAGTQARGGSFIGTYGRFPQWNARAHRVIALQDRIAECFLYSMNGRPPPYDGARMIGIVAYIAWLSRGVPTGAKQSADGYAVPLPSAPPDRAAGAQIYARQCSVCHGADGQGLAGVYPPLWGRRSFNDRAGMAHVERMAGFVRYNMPQNAPGSLTVAEAYDVAAFVLGHKRPRFRRDATIAMPSRPAAYF